MFRQGTIVFQRQSHKQELRRLVLQAAREIFVEEGYESFSMRRLAKKIRYSPGSIYLHFRNKQELFDTIVEESFSHLREGMIKLQQSGQGGDPVKMLRKGLRGYVRFGLRHANDYRFAFLIRPPAAKHPYKVHAPFEALRDIVSLCVKQKRFRAVDVDTVSQALWAAAHGITALLIQRPAFPWAPRQRLIDTVIDNSINSLLARPRLQPPKKRSPHRK